VLRLEERSGRITEAILADGSRLQADRFIVALPWHASHALLPAVARPREQFELLQTSPITGVHLFFDRTVTELEFAALPGRPIHWFFNKTSHFDRAAGGTYLQLVTSASRDWMTLGKREILEICLRELAEALPESRGAGLAKSYVLKEPAATFSPSIESETQRPSATTAIDNLFLAGDWIRTGWPATMEGAVRGGYLAAEAILHAEGISRSLLVPDLAPTRLVRLLRRKD
jgi:zeta-carotene desaturase